MGLLAHLSLRAKFAAAVTLSSALVTALLALLYLGHSVREARQNFIADQQLFALYFSDRAAGYVEDNRLNELNVSARTAVFGSYLYAQVVRGGQVLAEEKAPQAEGLSLPLIMEVPKSHAEVRRLPTGQAYLDIVHSFSIEASGSDNPNPGASMQQGYVRIGVALTPLEVQLGNQTLTIASWSVGLIFVVFLLAWAAARLLFGSSATTVPSTQKEIVSSLRQTAAPVHAESRVPPSGELSIDDATKQVTVRGQRVELSPKEYEVLKLLASGRGRVFSSDDILAQVWTGRGFASAQDVKQYIYFLRQKLEEDPEHPTLIITVRGFGYKLAD